MSVLIGSQRRTITQEATRLMPYPTPVHQVGGQESGWGLYGACIIDKNFTMSLYPCYNYIFSLYSVIIAGSTHSFSPTGRPGETKLPPLSKKERERERERERTEDFVLLSLFLFSEKKHSWSFPRQRQTTFLPVGSFL